MPEADGRRESESFPLTSGLDILDLVNECRSASEDPELGRFRDAFYFSHSGETIFRYPIGEGKYEWVGYLMALCKSGDIFCLRLAKDRSLPAPGERRDFPCGCTCVSIDFSPFEDMNTADPELIKELVSSKMREACERAKERV